MVFRETRHLRVGYGCVLRPDGCLEPIPPLLVLCRYTYSGFLNVYVFNCVSILESFLMMNCCVDGRMFVLCRLLS